MGSQMSRRAFLGLGATAAAVAGATMAGCSPAKQQAEPATANADTATQSAGADGVPSFLVQPGVPQDVAEEKDCDVLVLGLGLSGTAAAKAATDEGAKVIAVEKQPEDTYSVVSMAGDWGIVGSKIQKDLGIEIAPKEDIVNEIEKECGWRADASFWSYWYDHSGEDFDWFIEGADYEVLDSSAQDLENGEHKPNYIRPKAFPPLEGYDYRKEYYPYFHGSVTTNPNMGWACEAARNNALENGLEVMYGTTAEQIIKDGDAVVGAYVKASDGTYTKVNAKAVVITCGDYGANPEMRQYYAPETVIFEGGVNTGDGQRMGIWAGGRMERGPHAPTTHHMGGVLGVDSFLQLNTRGKRFMNEDIPGQNITDVLVRQPVALDAETKEAGIKSWQIFDSKWPEQIGSMNDGHGYINHYVPADEADKYTTVLNGFKLGYVTDQMVEEQATVKADSIEELAGKMKLDPATVKAEIDRYNELCHKGHDDDFGKMPERMFPVENPPFYACSFGVGGMLYIFGGLECDRDMHVVDDDDVPIKGLYVAGNSMGRRFLVEKPVVVAGLSLATATSFGRLAGKNAAIGI